MSRTKEDGSDGVGAAATPWISRREGQLLRRSAVTKISDDVFGLGYSRTKLCLPGLVSVNNRVAELTSLAVHVFEEGLAFRGLGNLVRNDESDGNANSEKK